MHKNNNGVALRSMYDTPFADEVVLADNEATGMGSFISPGLSGASPFRQTYDSEMSTVERPEFSEAYVSLLGELNSEDFRDALRDVAGEIEESIVSRYNYESADDQSVGPAEQKIAEYLNTIANEVEVMIDGLGRVVKDREGRITDSEIDRYFNETEFDHAAFSPAQEQLFGSIVNKVKGAVKAGIKMASSILPTSLLLGKLKQIVRPLLRRVLDLLIGRLPQALQPAARELAKKFVSLEVGKPGFSSTGESVRSDYEAIQMELDVSIANLVFTGDRESEELISNYIAETKAISKSENKCLGLLRARRRFIRRLQEGEDMQPAVEEFLPALYPVVKVAIAAIGRKKINSFLAGLIVQLIGKYVPKNIATPLAQSIVEAGMTALGFEVDERADESVAYEAIANTIEETVRNLAEDDQALRRVSELSDQEAIEQLPQHLLPAFKGAVANNFPSKYVRKSLQPDSKGGFWIQARGRNGRKPYKKFTRVFDITLTPQQAFAIKTFGGTTLRDFLQDTMSQQLEQPLNVKVHLYEALADTTLAKIALYETIISDHNAGSQLHPLTTEVAGTLLNEPGIGKDVPAGNLSSRDQVSAGQRFYYVHIPGAFAKKPRIRNHTHRHKGIENEVSITARTSDVQAVFNFITSEISLNFFISESATNELITRINKSEWVSAVEFIGSSIKGKLSSSLIANARSKVKLIHEAVPELFVQQIPETEEFASGLKKAMVEKAVQYMVKRIVSSFFPGLTQFMKRSYKDLTTAVRQPDDGVTIRIVWKKVPGMNKVRAFIRLVRGEGSLSELRGFSMPNLPNAEFEIFAGKKFL